MQTQENVYARLNAQSISSSFLLMMLANTILSKKENKNRASL